MSGFFKGLSVLLIIGALGTAGYSALENFFSSSMYQEVTRENISGEVKEKPTGENPFTILLLGTDAKDMNSGRADTILVAVVDPSKGKIKLLSIPRDTRVENASTGNMDKINHSFNQGLSNTILTVERFLDIPVDYYAMVNFNGFMELIDLNGGISLNVEKDLSFHDRIKNQYFTLNEGEQTLDGYSALNYARYRGDYEGDFGRNRRQQQVLTALIDQSVNLRNVGKITDAMSILGDNAKTDLSFNDITKLAFKLNNISGSDVESISMEANPEMISGISYVTVSDEEKSKVQTTLKTLLKKQE